MIISVDELKRRINCGSDTDEVITAKLEAIEAVIRAYTNNNFQRRAARLIGHSDESYVYGVPLHFGAGDTVQITSKDGVNDGLYEVVAVLDDYFELNKSIFACDWNVVTKIEYPADVKQCAVDLYTWKQKNGDKVGVKSETISRHSVTYEDSATLYMGYPVGILNGLKLHKKVRC